MFLCSGNFVFDQDKATRTRLPGQGYQDGRNGGLEKQREKGVGASLVHDEGFCQGISSRPKALERSS